MIKEFAAVLEAFKQGKEVTNPAAWKNGAIVANLATLIGAAIVIAGGFGYEINLSDAVIQHLAVGIGAAYLAGNAIRHAVTSKKVGLPSKGDPTDQYPQLDHGD